MARALWTGAISFGLVNIPVKLYRATASASGRSVAFHLLHAKCGTRIKNVRRCPRCEVDVPWGEVVKGYEVEKGRYVQIGKDELDALLPKDDYAAVSIESFAKLEEVDPVLYDSAYLMAPDRSSKPYALLHHALAKSGRVGIARVVLRTRSHLAVVRARDKHLVLETMYFADEIVDPADVPGLGEAHGKVDKKQEEAALQLIDSMTTTFAPARYKDDYAEQVKKLVAEKVETGEVSEDAALPATDKGAVVNLLDALKRSLKERDQAAPARRPRRAAAPRRRAPRRHAG